MEIYIKTAWKHPLLNHFECWTLNAIQCQCRIRFWFHTCLNKRVADEFLFFVDETRVRRT